MKTDGMRASRIVALALAVGAFFVAQEVLTDLASGKRVDFTNDVEVIFLFWATWACLTPAVLTAVRRWPLDLKPASRPLLAHVVTAVLLSATQSAIAPVVRAASFAVFDMKPCSKLSMPRAIASGYVTEHR
jgi:hypothetical protein